MQFNRPAARRPKRLKPDAAIGIVAPSSPFDEARYRRGLQVMQAAGFNPVESDGLFRRNGYLAGSDRQRAEQFNVMMCADGIDAVMCARGGFGAMKMLERLDFDAIGQSAKALIGFSDITALHQAIYIRANLATFHGPTVTTLATADDVTIEKWIVALTDPQPICLDLSGAVWLSSGRASGVVRGGNLATLCHLVGTPFAEDFQGAILLIEETGEAPYRIDRMLTQMKLAGLFDGVAGVLLGSFEQCGDLDDIHAMIADFFADQSIPVAGGLNIGHGNCNYTIPLGMDAHLDSDRAVLAFATAALDG